MPAISFFYTPCHIYDNSSIGMQLSKNKRFLKWLDDWLNYLTHITYARNHHISYIIKKYASYVYFAYVRFVLIFSFSKQKKTILSLLIKINIYIYGNWTYIITV